MLASTSCAGALRASVRVTAGRAGWGRARSGRRWAAQCSGGAGGGSSATGGVRVSGPEGTPPLDFASREKRFFFVGGKGGVGKTSMSSALAVQFAAEGHATLLVSTDPAHSLRDSLDQDVGGGEAVRVQGTELELWAMEIDPEQARQEFSELAREADIGQGLSDMAGSLGLGGLVDQLKDLRLGELLDTPPPGLDEAAAIGKVVQFVDKAEYTKFTRVVIDTAPTGHTLRLLSLPDFVDKGIGKLVRLRAQLRSAGGLLRGLFGQGDDDGDASVDKLAALQKNIQAVADLFRDAARTEFIIVSIPTLMSVRESGRLAAALREEGVPCRRMIVNQCIPDPDKTWDGTVTDCKFMDRVRKSQRAAIKEVEEGPGFSDLQVIRAPLFDLEVRGVPALQFLGRTVFHDI